MRSLFIVLAMLTGSLALAQAPSDGTVSESGQFTFRGGLWWDSAGASYTRERVANPTTYSYSYGCYRASAPSYYWAYTRVAAPPAKKKVAAVPGWRADLLRLAAAKQAVDGKLKLAQEEQKEYADSLKILGLEGYFRSESYSAASSTGVIGSYGVQGSTVYGRQTKVDVYGTSLASLINPYGDQNINVMYQQLARNISRMQDLTGAALSGQTAAVAQAGENARSVAEIIAKGQVAVNTIRALQPPPSSTTTTIIGQTGTSVTKVPPVPAGEAIPPMPRVDDGAGNISGEAKKFLREVGTPKCAECHTGDKAKGGEFRINDFHLLTAEQRKLVTDRILETDPKKVMPPPTSKGGPLTDAEKLRFLTLPPAK